MLELLDEKVYVRNEMNAAKMRLSAPEVDLFVLLATKVKGNDYQQITVTYDELVMLYGDSRVHYKALAPIFQGMIRNVIEVYDAQQQKYINVALVTRVDFSKRQGFAVFYLDVFVANMLQYVKAHSTIFQLRTVLELRSVHAKRIYMMASQFKKSGYWNIGVDELKDRLGLIDKKKGTELYSRFSNFQKRVLDQAVKEINDKAEFKIEILPGVQGKERKTISTIIYIKSIVDEVKLGPEMVKLANRMRVGGLSDFQIENILFSESEKAILKIMYNFDLNKSKIGNPGGYLASIFASRGVDMKARMVDSKQLDLEEEIKKQSAA